MPLSVLSRDLAGGKVPRNGTRIITFYLPKQTCYNKAPDHSVRGFVVSGAQTSGHSVQAELVNGGGMLRAAPGR